MAYAFFDVDETLIYPKSMFDFLQYWYDQKKSPQKYDNQIRLIDQRVKFGADRGDINAFYYRQFKGVGVNELMQAGIGWFNLRLEQGSLFKQSTIECLKELQGKGVSPVLVSGSMLPLLNPIAKWLGVKYILCTELVSVAGSLTGELTASAIGSAKRDRILAFLAENKVQADQCYAFGDHISDLPMLETVAWPTAVDPCAQLASVATSRGWPILTSQFFKLNG